MTTETTRRDVSGLSEGLGPAAWMVTHRGPNAPEPWPTRVDSEAGKCALAQPNAYTVTPLYALPADWALFEVVNVDGLTEASTEGPRKTALAEAMHYAHQYGQDGTVTVFEVLRVPLVVIAGPNV